jgi:rfaE bifunctional protein nucleotidyltransferase chain/domain
MENHILKVLPNELTIINNHTNLKNEKHSIIDYSNKICVKPWGHEFLVYQTNRIAIWCLTIFNGHQTSLHCHFNKDTQIIILKGAAKISLIDNKDIYLSELSSIFLPHYNFHGISAFSEEVCLLEIEIFCEQLCYSDKNDLLRINDDYNRKNTGYEGSVNILDSKEDLQKYRYFNLNNCNDFSQNIEGVDIQISKMTNEYKYPPLKWQNNQYNILLSGSLFQKNQYIKEGTIINDFADDIQLPQDYATILSLRNIGYKNNSKIIYNNNHLKLVVDDLKSQKKTIILSSGCFDIIHVGHLNTLSIAKKMGDILIVCLSSDEQIKKLKGKDRPINNYQDRIDLFKTIDYVDFIVLYNEENIKDEGSLGVIMKIVDPDFWIKGNDYTKEEIVQKHPYLRNICLIPNIDNKSTTNIIKTILKKG